MLETFYIVNAKIGAEMTPNMKRAAKQVGAKFVEMQVNQMSFYCPRETDKPLQIFYKEKVLEVSKNDYFFLRKWKPNGAAVAVLGLTLKNLGVPFSDAEMNLRHDVMSSKLSQPFQLKGKVAFPDTWVFPPKAYKHIREELAKRLGFPIIIKVSGSHGKNVWMCHSLEELDEKVAELWKKNKPKLFVAQEFVENDSDIRVMVWRDKVLAPIRRLRADEFRNSAMRGGAEAVEISKEEEQIALTAARELKLDLAGIDLVRTKYGSLIFECNKAPDISCFNEAAGFLIEEEIVKRIFEEYGK